MRRPGEQGGEQQAEQHDQNAAQPDQRAGGDATNLAGEPGIQIVQLGAQGLQFDADRNDVRF
jgi:hypothetical protein